MGDPDFQGMFRLHKTAKLRLRWFKSCAPQGSQPVSENISMPPVKKSADELRHAAPLRQPGRTPALRAKRWGVRMLVLSLAILALGGGAWLTQHFT